MRAYKINRVFYSLGVIALGAVLLMSPDTSLTLVSRGIGIFVLAGGVLSAISALRNRTVLTGFFLMLAVVMVLLGLWILSNPYTLASLVPTLLGVVIVLSGILNIGEAVVVGRNHGRWISSLLMGLVTAALGVWIITRAFGIAEFITRLGGVALIFDGLTDLLIAWRMKPSQAAAEEGPIDVESHEVSDGTVPVQEESTSGNPVAEELTAVEEHISEEHISMEEQQEEKEERISGEAEEAVVEAMAAAEAELMNVDLD